MKLSTSLLALSALALSLGAQAAPATGSLGGGTGTFLTLGSPTLDVVGTGGTLSGLDSGVDVGGTVFDADHPTFAATPMGANGGIFLAVGAAPDNEAPAT